MRDLFARRTSSAAPLPRSTASWTPWASPARARSWVPSGGSGRRRRRRQSSRRTRTPSLPCNRGLCCRPDWRTRLAAAAARTRSARASSAGRGRPLRSFLGRGANVDCAHTSGWRRGGAVSLRPISDAMRSLVRLEVIVVTMALPQGDVQRSLCLLLSLWRTSLHSWRGKERNCAFPFPPPFLARRKSRSQRGAEDEEAPTGADE